MLAGFITTLLRARRLFPRTPPGAFTADLLRRFVARYPGVKFEVVEDLHLKATLPDQLPTELFLANLYAGYCSHPELKEILLDQYLSFLAAQIEPQIELLPRNIVPVMKDAFFVTATLDHLKERGIEEKHALVHEPYNEALTLLYGVDSPASFRYLTLDDLPEIRLDGQSLRSLAAENLKRVLPEVRIHRIERDGALSAVLAGGVYESSLILLDDFWKKERFEITGEIVIAVPARGFLFVADSARVQVLSVLRRTAAKMMKTEQYPMTDYLFIRKDGHFVVLDEHQ